LKPGTRSTVDEARKRFEGDDPLAQMEAQLRLRRTHEAIKRVVLRESVNQPLLVLIEDLHWIDSETQALLNLLADSIGTAKMLLLVNYRPEYTHGWGSKTCYRQVRLDPLGRESAEEMLAALLGPSSPVPDKRVDSLQRAPFETRPAEGRSSDTMSGRSP
jgi:predicted ATPase